MTKLRGVAGGRATAIKNRDRAIAAYMADPNHCKYCDAMITVSAGSKVSATKRKQFCDRSCAAKFNNRVYPKRSAPAKVLRHGPARNGEVGPGHIFIYKCRRCSTEVCRKRRASADKQQRIVCADCRPAILSGAGCHLLDETKGQLFERRKNWQSASSCIRNSARSVFASSGRPESCRACGYTHHVEICHLKSVSDFPDDATVGEINDLSNLVALCPNHHWELDNGLLTADALRR